MRGTQPQTINVPPLCFRADVSTLDDENRTVELVFSTGAAVERSDWFTGKRYLEKLSLKPEHLRLDRLNAGAPLLDAHSAWSINDQIGVVEAGSVRLTGKEARATVRFSKRASVDAIWGDVRDGIIRNVSVGYRVHKFEEEQNGNKLPTRTAVDWEPYEISMVPMPADTGARTRGEDRSDTNPCVIITRQQERATMTDPNQPSETLIERDPLDPGAPLQQRQDPPPAQPNDRDAGAEAERTRVQGIILAVRNGRLPMSFGDDFIARGTALVDVQTAVLAEVAKRDGGGPSGTARPTVQVVGDDPLVHVRGGIENALLHRVAPEFFKLEDVGRQYRGLTMLDTARVYLQAAGIRTTGMSKMELAGLALGLTSHRSGGLHSTSDYANLLADVTNKTLRRAYEAAPQTFAPIARQTTLPDFKPAKRLQLCEAPALTKIEEQGEFTRGTIGEGKEQYELATYGRVFGISRKAIVNDDTDAFSRVPTLFGRAARNLESNLVWNQILSNPTMADSVALFHATHGNLASASTVIDIANVGIGRAAMRMQRGLDGVELLNLTPKFLIVCPEIETVADQFVSVNLLAAQFTNNNPFAGKLTIICEPRLSAGITIGNTTTAGDANAWYLAASPDQIDIVEYAYLEGETGPVTESRIGFDIDGLEIKCRHDFAAKVIDHRGLFKNAGA